MKQNKQHNYRRTNSPIYQDYLFDMQLRNNSSTDIKRQVNVQGRIKSQGIKPLESIDNKKTFVLEPGSACEPIQEILSSTKQVENGVTTYMISKSLNGPLLALASKNMERMTTNTNTNKQLPQISEPIAQNLESQLSGYAVITHEGMYRNYNQDKVSIIFDGQLTWFGVYDGHGGDKCSQFLKETLHAQFLRNKNCRTDIKLALKQTFEDVERLWIKKGDKSGSCCLVTVIFEDICYVANLGDSRAILASEDGKKVYQITKDHKPSNPEEQKRILANGGKIYQTIAVSEAGQNIEQIVGPLRVFPGRLSTTRTFGDMEAKHPKMNGNPNVVISEPEIVSFSIKEHDFIIMGSDGLWDRIDNKEALRIAKNQLEQGTKVDRFCSRAAFTLLKQSMIRGSTDNISVIVIGLPRMLDMLNPPKIQKLEDKGTQHIKILTSTTLNEIPVNTQVQKKKKKEADGNKENYPAKLKVLDSRINQITQSVQNLTTHHR